MPQHNDATLDISAAVIASSPDAIVAADLDGKIIAWNPAAERLFGFPEAEAIGTDLRSLMPEQQLGEASKLLQQARSGSVVADHEVTRLRRDGSTFTGRLTVAPIRGDEGEIRATVAILHDASERKAIEKTQQRNLRLTSIGTLAAGIAHEVNNPVGGILMAAQYARTVLGRPEAREILEKALSDIETDARRCSGIVRGLLRFAREDQGSREPCDIGEIIGSAIDLAQKSLIESTATVRFEPDEALPPLTVNRMEMRQALVSVVVNALQADATSVRIRAAVDPTAAKLVVRIMDDGAGVPPEDLAHVFDPFFTRRRRSGNVGLGLSLVHSIVMDHGGQVDMASSHADGTTVRIELPLDRGTD